MTLSIVSAAPASVEHGLGVTIDLPVIAVVGVDDGQMVGTGGLAWGGGRCWIWFKMLRSRPGYAVSIVRATRQMLRRAAQLGETEVFTPHDTSEPTSEKLLRLIGFSYFASEIDASGVEQEVWKWTPDNG